MNKPVFGLLLGGILGVFDGLSALVSAPETAPQIVGIVIGSTVKGLLAGVVIGLFARKVKSVPLTILFGLAVSAALAFWVASMQGKYYLEIMLPGSVLGVVVGYATQKFGERRAQAAALLLPLLLVAPPLRADEPAGKLDGRAAFETLKTLAGAWKGNTLTEDGAPGETRFRVTAGGHAVEEVMFPGTDHEMVNMYHLVGGELVVTHYCSSGNRPEMKLDLAASKPDDLVFGFSGGANLDPAKDVHIHSARLLIEEGRLREEWSSWAGGKEAGVMKFFLKRAGA